MTDAELTALRDERDRLRVELENVADVWRVREVLVERDRLRVELEQQKRLNLQLAERLAACSQVLGRAAERKGFDLAAVVAAQAHKAGVGAIMGQWPGDETDAEIQAALAAENGRVCGCQEQGGVR